MSSYQIDIKKDGQAFRVSVAGVIDEDTDFGPYSLAGASQVEFHLSQVKSINSCGIREWIKWMETATTKDLKYFECPKVIIDQVNMVQGFVPSSGKIMSFFVPYYQDDSGTEKNILFTFGKEYSDSGLTPPASVKDDAGAEMEMDVVEAKYFKFLKK